ncbi:MAG: polysaccharide deacetylase family protein [Candidatus Thiosymbion ectosymbiont of Robbea hypermnestra]|nr:polysaccharide deacetylase family protein [Candidatus Thiosymbion ectosymbiont of Robbea hypermnestra]
MSGWLHGRIKHGLRFGFSTFLGVLTLAVGVSATAALSSPEDTLRAYYQAVDTGDCEEVRRLRPGYSLKSCKQFTHAALEKVETLKKGASHAILEIRVILGKKNEPEDTFTGTVELERKEHGWIIKTGSFKKRSEDFDKDTNATRSLYADSKVPDLAGNPPVFKLLHGSQYLLRHCWTQDQLEASPGEDQHSWEDGSRNIPPTPPADSQDWGLSEQGAEGTTIRSVRLSAGSMAVALTFNLIERANEGSGYDGALVDVLRRERIPATFFASGKWLLSHPERTRQLMADPLFEIGLLGWNHRNLALLGQTQIKQQLQRAEAAYRKVRDRLKANPCTAESKGAEEMSLIAPAPTLFRFPYGRCNRTGLRTVAAFGFRAIQWNLVLDDIATDTSVESIVEKLQTMPDSSGTILVGHGDGRGRHTAAAIKASIPDLRERGYEFVTVSQLLNQGEPVTANSCYEYTPNDNLGYDKCFSD